MTVHETIAFDIETTGFAPADQVTVLGLELAAGSRLFLYTDGRSVPADLEASIDAASHAFVRLSCHDSESELLQACGEFVASTLDGDEHKLVAFNGETWKGGFDLPFLRTRCQYQEITWPFRGLPYVDIQAVIEARFNTTDGTLETTYEELIAGRFTELDPFADSAEAVTAWEEGDFEPLLLHNLADIKRTRALARLAEQYCSRSDFNMKSLQPIAHE